MTQTVGKAATSICWCVAQSGDGGQSFVFTATLLRRRLRKLQFLDGTALLATVPVNGGSASFTSTRFP